MNSYRVIVGLFCAAALWLLAGCGAEKSSAETPTGAPQRQAKDVINGMRLKQFTKSLQLSDEQQAKFKVLFDEEAEETDKLNADSNLSMTQRLDQIAELKKQTYEKMKPLLSETQAEQLEQILKKSARRKK